MYLHGCVLFIYYFSFILHFEMYGMIYCWYFTYTADYAPATITTCLRTPTDCCYSHSTIPDVTVTRCPEGNSHFYVYFLKQVSLSLSAYCVGNGLNCQTGEVYNPLSQTCTCKLKFFLAHNCKSQMWKGIISHGLNAALLFN